MKFFDCKTAPSPRRVRIFLAEKGLDIETVQIDLGAGEQFGETFRKINPDCVVPALELDDGSCIEGLSRSSMVTGRGEWSAGMIYD